MPRITSKELVIIFAMIDGYVINFVVPTAKKLSYSYMGSSVVVWPDSRIDPRLLS